MDEDENSSEEDELDIALKENGGIGDLDANSIKDEDGEEQELHKEVVCNRGSFTL